MRHPLPTQHQEVYATFISKIVDDAANREFTRSLVGRHVVTMLTEQRAEMAKALTAGEPIDTFKYVGSFILALHDYVKWMAEKGDEFRVKLDEEFKRLTEAWENKARHSWMTDHGKFRLQRALDLQPMTGQQSALFPLRTRAMTATLITAYDALAVASPAESWKIALEAFVGAYKNYRFDFVALTKTAGPAFIAQNVLVTEMVQDIDERIASIERKAKERVAAELAAERAAAEALEDDEETTYVAGAAYPSGGTLDVRDEPLESSSTSWEIDSSFGAADNSYWVPYEQEYNPANGLPMVGGYDIHNNLYGTNYNDY